MLGSRVARWFAAPGVCIALLAGNAGNAAEDDALVLFQRRIAPILQAKNPSSCSECHLSGVDLKQYIGRTQEETFAGLRDAGLIDVGRPEASKLLQFIARKPKRPSPLSAKVREQELAAFQAWIAAAVKDPKLTAARTTDAKLGPRVSDEVIRHARKDRVLASFIDNVWSEIGRCAACHSPDRNQQHVKKHGEQVSWIALGDPEATLAYLLEADLLDLKSPEKSLLLLKPTNQVMHGGGVKLSVGDRTYKQFRTFIDDYAASRAGKYERAEQLPAQRAEASAATDIWLKLTDVPAQFDKRLLQVDLYRWDEARQSWTPDRWATGDRLIAGERNLWQQHLSVTAPRGSARATQLSNPPNLPPGKYLLKVYIDRDNKLQKAYPAELGPAELVGEIEITSRWLTGYGKMTVAKFAAK